MENAINTECDTNSTPKVSTPDYTDHRGVVFNEMIGVTNGLLACVCRKDVQGIQTHLTDLQHMLDSLTSDTKDIPGQIGIEEVIGGGQSE